jgi:hypothetical protein
MYAERLAVSAGVGPLRPAGCPRCTPATIVVGGVQEGRAYERKSIEAIMAEKPMVSETEPRKPRRESCMHKMRTREPAPAATKQLTSLLIVPLPPCSVPQRVNRRADYPLQMTNEILSDTKVIFTHGNAVIPFGHCGYIRLGATRFPEFKFNQACLARS